MNFYVLRVGVVAGLATCVLVVACSSSKTDPPALSFSTAAAVAGPVDTHCAGKPIVDVNQDACHWPWARQPDADAADTDGGAADGGAADAGGTDTTLAYGATEFGSEGEDDDCKYHVKWRSTAVAQNRDVTFEIVATARQNDAPVTGAMPYPEVFLDDTHPAPNTSADPAETTPGTYTIGPVRFDAPGNWTVRFHFHDECLDTEPSPHGHATFFVKVP